MSYTRDRAARRARLKARGDLEVVDDAIPKPGPWRPSCPTCADTRFVIVQPIGAHRAGLTGRQPCPDCQGAA